MNENQKGGRLDDETITEEVIASSEHVVKRGGSFGNVKGLQQHFTPKKLARFIALVLGSDRPVIDLTAGDGSLLSGFGKVKQFGIEIDGSQIKHGEYEAIKGDVQHVIPLLDTLKAEWPVAVLNPPFGLDDWSSPLVEDGRPVGSTRLTFELALRVMRRRGWGAIICGRDRFARDIEPNHSEKMVAVFEVEDIWEDVALPCVVAFFVRQPLGSYNNVQKEAIRRKVSAQELCADAVGLISDIREHSKSFNPYAADGRFDGSAGDDLRAYFRAAQTEYDRRLGRRIGTRKSRYDLSIQSGLLHYAPTPYARMNLERAYRHEYLLGCHKKSVNWFTWNRQEWQRIELIEKEVEGFTIDPAMARQVEEALTAALDSKVPLYDLKPQQRIGYLTDADVILCTKTDEDRGIEAGQKYPVECNDAERIDTETNRPTATNSGVELKSFKIRHKFLNIQIRAGRRFLNFGESKEDIEYLMEHFQLPDVGTVATRWPEEVARYHGMLKAIEAEQKGVWPYDDEERGRVKGAPAPWAFHPFQIQDLSRAAVKKRFILAWEQGGGKTLAEIAWIKLMFQDGRKKKALIVCPQDLIEQTMDEWTRFAGEQPQRIGDWETAVEVAEHLRQGGEGIYITHYELLSRSGSTDMPLPADWQGESYEKPDGTMGVIGLMGYKYEPAHKRPDWDAEGRYVEVDVEAEFHRRSAATHCPQCGADSDSSWRPPMGKRPGQCDPTKVAFEADGGRYIRARYGCGYRHVGMNASVITRKAKARTDKERNKIAAHHRRKPVASILGGAFRGGVVVYDEITKFKGDDSQIAKAVRAIRCGCILGLSGTPIKNYIKDAFWPMWVVLGNNNPRFPYDYEGKNRFAQDFSAYEWEMKDDGKKSNGRSTATVTNLMKLWPLIASGYIRRRKEEMGVEVVPRTFYPTVVPLGVKQREQQHTWLQKFPQFWENENPEHRVTKAGMHHFLAPILGLNEKLRWASILPEGDKDRDYWNIAVSNWTPKNVKTMEIAMHHAAKGDKVLIGSTRIETAEWMSNELGERGVEVETLLKFQDDGPPLTKPPAKRSAVLRDFQAGEAQVLCSTLEALAFGHNLDKASVVILQALPWDFATLDQFLARVHRLSSVKPVSVYVILGKRSIDERMWQLLTEKGESAQLALDGRLIEQDIEEIKEADVIREMMERGIPISGDEVPETAIEQKWQSVRSVADLGEFNRAEAADVMNKVAEKTDATTFEEPTTVAEVTEMLAHVVESIVIDQLEGFASTNHSTEVEDGGGELRVPAEPEEDVGREAEQALGLGGGEEGEEEAEHDAPEQAEMVEAEINEFLTARAAEIVDPPIDAIEAAYEDEQEPEELDAPPVEEKVLVAAGGQSFFDFDF